MLFFILITCIIIQPSEQLLYSCNSTVVCGCSTNSASITRIVGGENALESVWSWAVSIKIAAGYLCGGSIISSSWVVTAAHCIVTSIPSQISIYAGSTATWTGSQTRQASRIIVHPNYNSYTYENDIALLQLESPLIMTDSRISSICIPSVSSSLLSSGEWPSSDTTVVAVGWGKIVEGGNTASILQQVTLSTVSYYLSTCRPLVNDVKLQLCAGVSGGGKDTCQGDSGGPLMMFTANRQWVLVGITSNGIGCARPTSAGVYTRVAAYENWINSNTNGSYWPVYFSNTTIHQASILYSVLFILFLFCIKF